MILVDRSPIDGCADNELVLALGDEGNAEELETSGIEPGSRAARLDPIEALRYE